MNEKAMRKRNELIEKFHAKKRYTEYVRMSDLGLRFDPVAFDFWRNNRI